MKKIRIIKKVDQNQTLKTLIKNYLKNVPL